jgi:hypothetical protein
MTPTRIRNAVALVENFSIKETGIAVLYYHPTVTDDFPQWYLDALAAQMVREVDALNDQGIHVEITSTTFQVIDAKNGRAILGQAYGTDRTENTINAITESEVLK